MHTILLSPDLPSCPPIYSVFPRAIYKKNISNSNTTHFLLPSLHCLARVMNSYPVSPPTNIYTPIPKPFLNPLTLSLAASLLHFGNIIYSSSCINTFVRSSTSSLGGGVVLFDLANQLTGRSAFGVVGVVGNVFALLILRNFGNQGVSLLSYDDVDRVGDGEGEGRVGARLNVTISDISRREGWGVGVGIMPGS